MTASGQSIAQLLVDDFMHGLQSETVYNTNDYLWSAVPMGIVKKYVRDQGLVNRAVRLAKEGKHARSLFYKKDMGLLRRLRLMKMDHDFYEDYRVNMPL
jgi:D-aspartate ligase